MILRARVDRARAVDLLGEHDARQMVRECHRRHAQPQRRLALEALVEAERPADEKAHLRRAARGVTGELPRERLAREEFALDAHGDHGRALRDARANGQRLFFQRGVDLFLRRALRQALLRQLHQVKPAIGAQPLGIFRECGDIIGLAHLSDADEGYRQHTHAFPAVSASVVSAGAAYSSGCVPG